MHNPENIRNVAVVGHQGSGKTSLVESLAYKAGLIREKGTIEKKNTLSDCLPMEKDRQVSISSSVIPIEHDGTKINLLDLPGNDDFIFETIGITRLIKGAILVIDASKGVQTGTVKAFHLLKKRGVPMFLFLNKMDKENVDFNALYEEIKLKLDEKKCVPFSYPIGRKENFDGFVNVVELKARKYNGVTCEDDVIYDDKKEIVFALHNRLCEAVATVNDAMLLKNKVVFIHREDAALPEGHFFLADLIGARVLDADSGEELGTLAEVLSPAGQQIYVVRGKREILIPAVEQFVVETNVDQGYIRVRLIEGL